MGEKELRRSLAVFPIGTVTKLTDLSKYDKFAIMKQQRLVTSRTLWDEPPHVFIE